MESTFNVIFVSFSNLLLLSVVGEIGLGLGVKVVCLCVWGGGGG